MCREQERERTTLSHVHPWEPGFSLPPELQKVGRPGPERERGEACATWNRGTTHPLLLGGREKPAPHLLHLPLHQLKPVQMDGAKENGKRFVTTQETSFPAPRTTPGLHGLRARGSAAATHLSVTAVSQARDLGNMSVSSPGEAQGMARSGPKRAAAS